MFICSYCYPSQNPYINVGKISIFNYLRVMLTSLRDVDSQYRFVLRPIRNSIGWSDEFKNYSKLSASPLYCKVKWIASWKVRKYIATKQFCSDWAIHFSQNYQAIVKFQNIVMGKDE